MSKRFEDLPLLDFVEGRLKERSADEFLEQVKQSGAEQELRQYRAVIGLEQLVASQQPLLTPNQSEAILAAFSPERLENATGVYAEPDTPNQSFHELQNQHLQSLSRLRNSFRAMLTVNAALMLVLVGLILSRTEGPHQPQIAGIIPEGYVLVSVEVPLDPSTITPFEHVDLKVSYQSSGQEVVRDLGRYLPVHAIEPVFDSSVARSRLSILMPESQATNVRYARILGELEISPISPISKSATHERIVRDPAGRAIALGKNQMPAVLYMNQGSSISARLVYRDGNWVEDPHVRIRAF